MQTIFQNKENEINETNETSVLCNFQAGVDEVARGPLFGPVFAAAVILNPDVDIHPWLNDSKKVTKKRRHVVKQWIEETAIAFGVAYITNDIIDQINIRNAAYLAMELAIKKMCRKQIPNLLLIDGDYFPGTKNFGKYNDYLNLNEETLDKETLASINHVCIVGGDAKYANIAAASILAKECHDEYIRDLLEKHPELQIKYGLETNMGYGTKNHILAIQEYGPTSFHRMTFLKRILSSTSDSNLKTHFFLSADSDS